MMDQEKQNNQDQNNFYAQQDDEYGLPVAEYSPLDYEQPVAETEDEEPVQTKRAIDLKPEKEERTTWPIWVAMIILLAAGGFSLYYFVFNKPAEQPVVPVAVQQQPEPEPEAFVEETPAPVEEWTPPVQKEGSVTAISAKTGRYYVIIGSFIDGDMANDYAKKLAAQGKQVTLIEPAGQGKFYRLGVLDAASFAEASDELDNLKNTFGQDIWIVRY